MNAGRHLADQELVDAARRQLADVRTRHLASCPRCAAQVAEVRAIAARAAGVEVPEPSPFFWAHLRRGSGRRSPRRRRARAGGLAWPWRRVGWRRGAAALIVVASSLAGFWPHRTPTPVAITVAVHDGRRRSRSERTGRRTSRPTRPGRW